MRVKRAFLQTAILAPQLGATHSFLHNMVSTRRSAIVGASKAATKLAAKKKSPTRTPKTTKSKAVETNSSKKKTVIKPTTVVTQEGNRRLVLFALNQDEELIQAKLIARPSKRNRSPYVADVWIESEQREAIAHVPNLDMGGKCVPGVPLLLKPARDNKGRKVGSKAVSPKYGTPKCEFITQLLHVDESHLEPTLYPPTWVGGHPSLGERIAESWLRHNLIPDIPPIVNLQTQIRNPCGADMRSDFLVTHVDGSKRIVEVKTVVDTDYSSLAPPTRQQLKCLFLSDQTPYQRTAIFPWGNTNQKGPNGEKVVSARAIHHIQELTRIAQGKLRDQDQAVYQATILFVVIRGDAESFRPNQEACPSFCNYLQQAHKAGVQVLAKRVSWGTGVDEGNCFDDKMLPIEWPNLES